jgi:hypothetical protein
MIDDDADGLPETRRGVAAGLRGLLAGRLTGRAMRVRSEAVEPIVEPGQEPSWRTWMTWACATPQQGDWMSRQLQAVGWDARIRSREAR